MNVQSTDNDWQSDPSELAALIEYLNETSEDGPLEMRDVLYLLRKPWKWADEHAEMRRQGRGSCRTCNETKRGELAPTHSGSPRCESGSIASGGKNAHCSCDTCF